MRYSCDHHWSDIESENVRVIEDGGRREVLLNFVSVDVLDGRPWRLTCGGYIFEDGYGLSNEWSYSRVELGSVVPERLRPVAEWVERQGVGFLQVARSGGGEA
jgi:hypothetical protein